MSNETKFRFTIVVDDRGGEAETLPTPPISLPNYLMNFKVLAVNVYQGEDGEELYTKRLSVSEETRQDTIKEILEKLPTEHVIELYGGHSVVMNLQKEVKKISEDMKDE